MTESRSDKITQATINHLDKTLHAPFYVNDFSTDQYLELLKHLYNLFEESSILSHLLAVEKGFKSFFLQSGQEIEIKLNQNSIKLSKVFKKNGINPALDKALFNLSQRLQPLKKNLKDFEIYSYLHEFPQDRVLELFDSFNSIELSKDDIRSHIREEVDLLLHLYTRDIILFLSKKMYVRNFVPPVTKTKGAEQRFNSCDPDKLTSIYEEDFPDDFSDKLLDLVPELESSALNFSHLENLNFHQQLPDTFRSFLDIAMLPFTENLDEETSLALNGYVLRLHFHAILEKLAEILMDKVLKRDKKADLFLKYYNGETVLNKKGQKIKKPSIIDSNNNTWNYSAIFSILTQYTQTRKNLQKHTNVLHEKESLYHKSEHELKKMKATHKTKTEELNTLKERIVHQRLEHKSLKLKSAKSSDKDLKAERNADLVQLRKKEAEYDSLNDLVNTSHLKLENHKTETHNRKQHLMKEQKTLAIIETNFKELEKNYKLIQAALAKAITGR